MADKNTLKQWFVTGAKPLQAQYWAWLDSYWHKSEPISINNIENLSEILVNKADADQLALYAKKDASNIDVPTWKTRLGVGELPPNIGTIDYTNSEGFSYVGNAYKKIENPNDGNVYVLNIDGTKVNANTFGKNITNSSNTTNGSYVQAQRVGDTWSWDTNGQPYTIKNLPNKSSDANFTDIVGKNSNGQFAKVGFPALKTMVSEFSQEQSLEISQLLNAGQGSAGMMSVNTISPPLFEKENNNVYLVLRGTNLDLSPLSMSIHIVQASDNSVLAQVPNSQIQLYADGLSLVFYYNFNALGVGDYKLRITSGAKVLNTTIGFRIVSQVQNIDISAITWNKLIDSTVITNDQSSSSGGNVFLFDNQNTKDTSVPVVSMLSSQMFEQGEDFYIEMQISIGTKRPNYKIPMGRVGICYSNTANQLAFIPIHFFTYGKYAQNISTLATQVNAVTGYIEESKPSGTNVVLSIIKRGNLLTLTDGRQVGILSISNNSGYSISVQLTASISNTSQGESDTEALTAIITKAFKII